LLFRKSRHSKDFARGEARKQRGRKDVGLFHETRDDTSLAILHHENENENGFGGIRKARVGFDDDEQRDENPSFSRRFFFFFFFFFLEEEEEGCWPTQTSSSSSSCGA